MKVESNLAILENLASGRISYDRALIQIARARHRRLLASQGCHRRLFSCLTVRIRRTGKMGLILKIPLFLASCGLTLACLNPKVHRQFRKWGIRSQEVHLLVRYLKDKEAGFRIEIVDSKGSKVLVHN
jgi:hypothetical protein